MDDNMMKDNIKSNSKRNSVAKSVLVRWKWGEHDRYRIFLGLRFGGAAETKYDLSVKSSDKTNDKYTVLIYADQLADFEQKDQVNHVVKLLTDEMWKWDPSKNVSFKEKVEQLLKAKPNV